MEPLNIRQVAIGDLVLDPRNPRIAALTETYATPPGSELIILMLGQHSATDEERGASTSFSSLKASIRANRGVMNPIIVVPSEAEEGKYVVIEGNTRVAIYLMLAKEGADGDWSTIPAILHAKGDERGEHAVRLQAHLVGPRPWRPYAKAKYLHDLKYGQHMAIEDIHAICGGSGRKREIEELIAAYTDMQDYYIPLLEGAPLDQSRFSAFVELQKPPVVDALIRHGHTKTDFAKWVGTADLDARFKPLQTVRALPRILANPAAKQKFLARGASEALRLLEQPASTEIIRDATIEQLASALAVKLRKLEHPDIRALREDPEGRTSQAVSDCLIELQSLDELINPSRDE